MKSSTTNKKELNYLNSKGHTGISVKCTKCKKQFRTIIETVRKNEALKKDTFICEEC
ncbi:MAG: hypothetical protein KJ771_00070 [Nanoarchaeota archaeon]|nr:hypothetical protein [Nanoarchaeota archaeon]